MRFAKELRDLYYIAKEKIQEGYIKVKDSLTRFFEKALSMMKIVINKLKKRVRGMLLGAAHFFRRKGNQFQEETRMYSVDEEIGDWYETTVTRDVNSEDVPHEYETMDDEFEIDDTKELEEAMIY